MVATFEGLHDGAVSAGWVCEDGSTLILGGLEDCRISISTLRRRGGRWAVDPLCILTGHLSAVTALTASSAHGAAVSVSEDGEVWLWDISKRRLAAPPLFPFRLPYPVSCVKVRPPTHTLPCLVMHCPPRTHTLTNTHAPCRLHARVQMSEVTGDVLVGAGPLLFLFDLNGRLSAAAHTAVPLTVLTHCDVRVWFDGRRVVTGHADGSVRVWAVDAWDGDRRAAVAAAMAGGQSGQPLTPPPAAPFPPAVEAVLAWAYAKAPHVMTLLATLDWHSSPVTALHVTPYVACHARLCVWPRTVTVCMLLLFLLCRRHVLMSGDAAGNVVEWLPDDAQ